MVPQRKRKPAPPRDKNDREAVTPPIKWIVATRTPDPGSSAPKLTAKQSEARAAANALDRILAARPLRPPPMPRAVDTRTAGALALAAEIREGSYEP